MIKTLKWLYKLGYDHAMNNVYRELERARDFHQAQEQIKYLTAKHEDGLDKDLRQEFKTTAQQHEQRRKAIEDVLNQLDPKKYPNIDNIMELLG